MAGFKSTEKYIATRDLEVAVNAAVTLQRPLLVKGEPGTGKTVLAHGVDELAIQLRGEAAGGAWRRGGGWFPFLGH